MTKSVTAQQQVVQRYTWEDALIDAKQFGLGRAAADTGLALARAITWHKTASYKPSGLYWKNSTAAARVSISVRSMERNVPTLIEWGFFERVAGNLIPCVPDLSHKGSVTVADGGFTVHYADGTYKQYGIKTDKLSHDTDKLSHEYDKLSVPDRQTDGPYSVDTCTLDLSSVDTCRVEPAESISTDFEQIMKYNLIANTSYEVLSITENYSVVPTSTNSDNTINSDELSSTDHDSVRTSGTNSNNARIDMDVPEPVNHNSAVITDELPLTYQPSSAPSIDTRDRQTVGTNKDKEITVPRSTDLERLELDNELQTMRDAIGNQDLTRRQFVDYRREWRWLFDRQKTDETLHDYMRRVARPKTGRFGRFG